MDATAKIKPVVLCVSGHDPIGGAGIQADIETLAALGCHAATAVTCQTLQDTRNVREVIANAPSLLAAQIETICDDLSPVCVKIGLLGTAELTAVVSALLTNMDIPVVLDPVLSAGGGKDLAAAGLLAAIRGLLPQIALATPNRREARRLCETDDTAEAARRLLEYGCTSVLVTGADEASGDRVLNQLFAANAPPVDFNWPRLAGQFHGSGCTLASACAAYLAHGAPLAEAVDKAQRYAWETLRIAHRSGRGQSLPGRILP